MFNNKKGIIESLVMGIMPPLILLFIIFIFVTYFFFLGGASSASVTIKAEQTPLAPRLPYLMQINTAENSQETLASLLIAAYLEQKSGNTKQAEQFKAIIAPLLNSMKNPSYEKLDISTAGWNLKVYSMPAKNEIKNLSIITSKEKEHFNEFLLVPANEPENPILLELYFSCDNCNENYLRSYA